MNTTLTAMPDDWKQALAVVAHPDDLEYGAASAIARWTGEGRSVAYVMVTDGEAGIDGVPPAEAAVLRRREQVESAAVVGVDDVTFLGHPDGGGRVRPRPPPRHRPTDPARASRHPDHGHTRADDTDRRRAAIPQSGRPPGRRRRRARRGPRRRQPVDVPSAARRGPRPVAGHHRRLPHGRRGPYPRRRRHRHPAGRYRLAAAHRAYLDGLGRDLDPEAFLSLITSRAGTALGVPHAVAFGRIQLQGI